MHRYQKEASELIKLATPVLIASIAQTGMGFVDTVMAGGVSATDMAAVAVASSIWMPTILFGIGLLMALVPVIAQLNGAGKSDKIAYEVQQGIFLASLLVIPTLAILIQTKFIVGMMDVDPLLAEKTTGYMNAMLWAVPGSLLYQALRSFADGMALTKPAMFIGFLGLAINIPLNWMFVYGKFGAPALGGVGCGVATAIVYTLMFLFMLFYIIRSNRLKHVGLFDKLHKLVWKEQIRLVKLGVPVAFAIFFEVTLFAVVALLVSPLGPTIVAAHQVAINFSSLVFMIPMSIGAAVSIRVGHKLGEENTEGAKIATHVSIALGLLLAAITGVITVVFREPITLLYTDDSQVLAIATQLLIIAAIYQLADSVQVIGAGALRGYKDMKAIFICTFIAYWVLGLPTGCILGLTDLIVPRMGVYGFWVGFIVGLTSAAILLTIRLRWMHRQEGSVQLEFASR
ncbi:MATE family efflux transporter [Vibrio sp. JC009]|uniref:MATE family efflux transporter n=1 Tax=Vibrio sp. JC009 TaxID=2912314 RepID=UPI0023AFA0A1|nr:MATE family efflux transporter [Vibrio sp. JC009]WED23132.1 MATE family efflux transporter [Vibrio sp. JC009]